MKTKFLKSNAYVLRESGRPPLLEPVEIDLNLSSGQVLMRMEHVGICATQVEEIYTASRNSRFMPHLLGHEGVGTVLDIGPGVSTKSIGERCFVHWRNSSTGLDSLPGKYYSSGSRINAGKKVTFAEHVVVPERNITRLPNELGNIAGVLLGCSASTGWGSTAKVSELADNSTVIICGLGAVGTAAAITAWLKGHTVYALDSKSLPREIAEGFGLEKVFGTITDMQGYFAELGHDRVPSLAVDTTGSAPVIQALQELLLRDGTLVLVGMPKGEKPRIDVQRLLDGQKIVGSNGGDFDPKTDTDLAKSTAVKFQELFGGRLIKHFPFDSLESALNAYLKQEAMKYVLEL